MSREKLQRALGPQFSARYEILEAIGRGGMATVFRGRDLRLDRVVAIKVQKADPEISEARLERFQFEAKAGARLNSPHVVNVYECGFEKALWWIVTELVEGCSLDQVLKERGKLSRPAALEAARQVALGLQVLHESEIVHRDLKPGNILVSAESEPTYKIADLGLAVADDRGFQTQAGLILGTPDYMAPEQILWARAEPAADLYALGTILFELLTGCLPFKDLSDRQLMRVKSKSPRAPILLSYYSSLFAGDLELLVDQLLVLDVRGRPASAQEVVDRLTRIQEEFRRGVGGNVVDSEPLGKTTRISTQRDWQQSGSTSGVDPQALSGIHPGQSSPSSRRSASGLASREVSRASDTRIQDSKGLAVRGATADPLASISIGADSVGSSLWFSGENRNRLAPLLAAVLMIAVGMGAWFWKSRNQNWIPDRMRVQVESDRLLLEVSSRDVPNVSAGGWTAGEVQGPPESSTVVQQRSWVLMPIPGTARTDSIRLHLDIPGGSLDREVDLRSPISDWKPHDSSAPGQVALELILEPALSFVKEPSWLLTEGGGRWEPNSNPVDRSLVFELPAASFEPFEGVFHLDQIHATHEVRHRLVLKPDRLVGLVRTVVDAAQSGGIDPAGIPEQDLSLDAFRTCEFNPVIQLDTDSLESKIFESSRGTFTREDSVWAWLIPWMRAPSVSQEDQRDLYVALSRWRPAAMELGPAGGSNPVTIDPFETHPLVKILDSFVVEHVRRKRGRCRIDEGMPLMGVSNVFHLMDMLPAIQAIWQFTPTQIQDSLDGPEALKALLNKKFFSYARLLGTDTISLTPRMATGDGVSIPGALGPEPTRTYLSVSLLEMRPQGLMRITIEGLAGGRAVDLWLEQPDPNHTRFSTKDRTQLHEWTNLTTYCFDLTQILDPVNLPARLKLRFGPAVRTAPHHVTFENEAVRGPLGLVPAPDVDSMGSMPLIMDCTWRRDCGEISPQETGNRSRH